MIKNEKIQKIIINSIAGDALGSTMEGLTMEHIKAVFKSISDFTDPEAALKNKLEYWRKPGLYTSISQLMILLSASIGKVKFNIDKFDNIIKASPEVENSQSGIFRHTDVVLNSYINKPINSGNSALQHPSVKLIPVCLPFGLQNYFNDSDFYNQARFCTLFTSDPATITGSLIFTNLIYNIINDENFYMEKIIQSARDSAAEIFNYSEKNSPKLFELKLNPNKITDSANLFLNIFEDMGKSSALEAGEKIIIEHLNQILKNNIKKVSIEHPLSVLPLAVLKSRHIPETENLLKMIVMDGGPASSTAFIAGAISGASGNSFTNESFLSKNLINKKNIVSLLNIISEKSWNNETIDDFLKSESHLTKKEIEEYQSKLKHYKKPEKTNKNRKTLGEKTAQHIVESWTKEDKAKWKKEKRKFNTEFKESND